MISPTSSQLDQVEWTRSRCTRLLRQITVPIATLRRESSRVGGAQSSTAKQVLAGQAGTDSKVIHAANIANIPSLNNHSPHGSKDPDWLPRAGRLLQTRHQYKPRETDRGHQRRNTTQSVPRCPESKLSTLTPQLRKIAFEQGDVTPAQQTTTLDFNPMQCVFSGQKPLGKRTKASYPGFRARVKCGDITNTNLCKLKRGFLEVLHATRAQASQTHSRNGVCSLFSTCLKSIPKLIQHEERIATLLPESQQYDVMEEVYDHLEAFNIGQNRGWKHIRSVVRAHALQIVTDAIKDGLIPLSTVHEIVEEITELPATSTHNHQLDVMEIRKLMTAQDETMIPTQQLKCSTQGASGQHNNLRHTCRYLGGPLHNILILENLQAQLLAVRHNQQKGSRAIMQQWCYEIIDTIAASKAGAAFAIKILGDLFDNATAIGYVGANLSTEPLNAFNKPLALGTVEPGYEDLFLDAMRQLAAALAAIMITGAQCSNGRLPSSARHAQSVLQHVVFGNLNFDFQQNASFTTQSVLRTRSNQYNRSQLLLPFLQAYIWWDNANETTFTTQHAERMVALSNMLDRTASTTSAASNLRRSRTMLFEDVARNLARMSAGTLADCMHQTILPILRRAAIRSDYSLESTTYIQGLVTDLTAVGDSRCEGLSSPVPEDCTTRPVGQTSDTSSPRSVVDAPISLTMELCGSDSTLQGEEESKELDGMLMSETTDVLQISCIRPSHRSDWCTGQEASESYAGLISPASACGSMHGSTLVYFEGSSPLTPRSHCDTKDKPHPFHFCASSSPTSNIRRQGKNNSLLSFVLTPSPDNRQTVLRCTSQARNAVLPGKRTRAQYASAGEVENDLENALRSLHTDSCQSGDVSYSYHGRCGIDGFTDVPCLSPDFVTKRRRLDIGTEDLGLRQCPETLRARLRIDRIASRNRTTQLFEKVARSRGIY